MLLPHTTATQDASGKDVYPTISRAYTPSTQIRNQAGQSMQNVHVDFNKFKQHMGCRYDYFESDCRRQDLREHLQVARQSVTECSTSMKEGRIHPFSTVTSPQPGRMLEAIRCDEFRTTHHSRNTSIPHSFISDHHRFSTVRDGNNSLEVTSAWRAVGGPLAITALYRSKAMKKTCSGNHTCVCRSYQILLNAWARKSCNVKTGVIHNMDDFLGWLNKVQRRAAIRRAAERMYQRGIRFGWCSPDFNMFQVCRRFLLCSLIEAHALFRRITPFCA